MSGVGVLRWMGLFAVMLSGCSGHVADGSGGKPGGGGTGGDELEPGPSGGASDGTGGTQSTGGTRATGGVGAPGTGGQAPIGCGRDPSGSARLDLATVCTIRGNSMCKFTAKQLLEGYECSPDAELSPFTPQYVMRKFHIVGCGRETVGWNGGYGGPSETFSLATGELVGAALSSDSGFGPCNSFSYVGGESFRDCADNVRTVCLPSSTLNGGPGPDVTCVEPHISRLASLLPRPECDCSRDPGVDPCFGPGTCDCWCSTFVPAARACAGNNW